MELVLLVPFLNVTTTFTFGLAFHQQSNYRYNFIYLLHSLIFFMSLLARKIADGRVTHVLEIDGVDFNIRENASKHTTSAYELVQSRQACVLRRGEPFTINLICRKRSYDPNRDKIKFTFEFGSHPSTPKGTKGVFELDHSDTALLSRNNDQSNWRAKFVRKSGQNLEVLISTPVNLAVGLWRLHIDTWYGERWSQNVRHTHPDPIYMLFNPFHQGTFVRLKRMTSHPIE